jgi:hypothetical protein
MEAGLLQSSRAQLDSYRRGENGVAVIERVSSWAPSTKQAVQSPYESLNEASQSDMLDHPATPQAFARNQPPPTIGVDID